MERNFFLSSSLFNDQLLLCRRMWRKFTLTELLVVIAVIALLASILFPSLSKAAGASRGIHCMNNVKSLALFTLQYAGDFNDSFPLGIDSNGVFKALSPWEFFVTLPGIPGAYASYTRYCRKEIKLLQCPDHPLKHFSWANHSYTLNHQGMAKTDKPKLYSRISTLKRPQKTTLCAENWGHLNEYVLRNTENVCHLLRTEDLLANRQLSNSVGYRHNNFSGNFAFGDGHCELISAFKLPDRQVGQDVEAVTRTYFLGGNKAIAPTWNGL